MNHKKGLQRLQIFLGVVGFFIIGVPSLLYSILYFRFPDDRDWLWTSFFKLSANQKTILDIICIIALCLSSFISYIVVILGRKLQPLAQEILMEDNRSPVLLLRPFKIDNTRIIPFQKGKISFYNLETALHTQLKIIGPVIAIGKPGEKIQPLGASRLYVINTSWQDEVNNLLERSRLIVIILEYTPGVQWEIEHILGLELYIDKTIFIPRPIILKREWYLSAIKSVPVIGQLIFLICSPFLLFWKHSRRKPYKRRGVNWYNQWNHLREQYPLLPAINDKTTCFGFDRNKSAVIFESESIHQLDLVNAIYKAINWFLKK